MIVINRTCGFTGARDPYQDEPTGSWIREGMANNGVLPPIANEMFTLTQVRLNTGEIRWILEWMPDDWVSRPEDLS